MSEKLQMSAYHLLEDPLSSATRSTRKILLAFSVIAGLIELGGAYPNEVSVFGLSFPDFSKFDLNLTFLFLILFSLVAFLVYAGSDYLRYRYRKDRHNMDWAVDADNASTADPASYESQEERFRREQFEEETGYKPYEIPPFSTRFIFWFRLAWDFVLPLIVSGAAVLFLIS